MNSKGGRALDKCKLEDGSWNVDCIMDGQRDDEARRQTHITKDYYPMAEWKQLEPLERRKVILNRLSGRRGADVTDQTQPVPANVSLTSASNASSISSLESSMSKMAKTLQVLVECNNDKMREISNLKRGALKAGLYNNLSESEASDIFGDESYDSDVRVRLKANKKKRGHPALGRQPGRARRGDD